MNKKLLTQIAFPLLMTALCGGIAIICMIRPTEILHAYMHTAFSDNSLSAANDSIADTYTESETYANESISSESESEISSYTEYSGEISDEGSVIIPEPKSQYAVLECTAADIYTPVYWGGGSELLEKGACHNPASAVAGASGNSVISAHFNTFFSNLCNMQIGDIVTLYTSYGKFTYEAAELISFDESDESYIADTPDNRLTLYTCKAELLGTSSERTGVVCTLKSSEFYNRKTGE